MKTSNLLIASLCFSAFGLFSCSDEEESKYTELTPDEHKEQLETIGMNIANKINPEVQKDLVQTFDALIEFSEYLTIEDNYGNEDDAEAVANFAKTMKSICGDNEFAKVSNLTRASNSELYSLARYAGVYTMTGIGEDEYGDIIYLWDRSDATDKLEFKFKVDGKNAVVSVTKEGEEQKFGPYDNDKTSYSVMVPAIVKATAKLGDKEVMSVVCNMKVDNSKKTVKSDINIEANGYKYTENIDVNSDNGTTSLTFSIDGDKLIEANAYINGKGMTNGDVIDDKIDNGSIQDLFGKGEAEVIVTDGKQGVKLTGVVSDVKGLVDKLNDLEDAHYEEESTEENSLKYHTKVAEAYNEFINGEMYYTDGDNVIARFSMQVYQDDEDFVDYDIEPILTFEKDGSKFSFQSYFDEVGFKGLIDSFEKLGDDFEAYLQFN